MYDIVSIPIVVPVTGVLLLMQQKEKDAPEVVAATDNSSTVLGYSPKQILSLSCLTEILDEFRQNTGQPIILPLSIIGSQSSHKQPFWCAVHKSLIFKGFLFVELEKDRRNKNFDPRRRRNRDNTKKSDISNPLETGTEIHSYSKISLQESKGNEKVIQVLLLLFRVMILNHKISRFRDDCVYY